MKDVVRVIKDDFIKRIIPPKVSLNIKFIIGCSITLIVTLSISFYIIDKRQEKLIMEQVEKEARALFKQIVITRRWVADHGGVFVERLPWMRPTPYIDNSEIVDLRGKRYIKEVPAMVTKELSKYSRDKGLYWFHITSLKLVNPKNAPDEFERRALLKFEKENIKELISIETIDNFKYLRYISPLYIEKPCLRCHGKQGYKIGDLRGAISITIPMYNTFTEISANRKNMFIAMILTIFILMSVMFLMMKKLVLTPVRELKSSIKGFSEGNPPPTNRLKTGDEFEALYNAFLNMAKKITEYHNSLNDKIKSATENLEETNRKLIEVNRILNEENIKKSDFIARASHELRTPLTSIKGAMDYILAKLSALPPDRISSSYIEEIYIFFDLIRKNSERLIRMVNNMLDLERIEMGVSELHFTNTDLSQLIGETLTYFQIEADRKGISFHTNISDNLYIYADEDRIKQVLINLLSNAIKFSPQDSEINVKAYPNGDFIITEIRDEGPGIPLSEQKKIFEKFYKNGNKEGSGLGLAICKSIIEAHKGIIGVNSRENNGSCFYFKLPVSFRNRDETDNGLIL